MSRSGPTMLNTRSIRRLVITLVAVAIQVGVWAQTAGVHPLSGRRIALPMSVAGADWLDRAEREQEEAPSAALRLMQVEPGFRVADIGAGSGYYTVRLARLVGPSGRVYASDIQQGMLDIIRSRIEGDGLTNVETVLGTPGDPRLPPASLDLVLMVDVYHEFSEPQAMLRRVREAMKPDGRLVLLEYRAEDPRVPIRPEHKMTVAQAKLEVEAEGFTLTAVLDELPWQHFLVFMRR